MYPNKEQRALLMQALTESCHLSNRMLEMVKKQREKNHRDVMLASDNKHLFIPKKLGGLIKMKLHRPVEGTPKTAHLVLHEDGHGYALIVCQTEPSHKYVPHAYEHSDIGMDVGLTSFLTEM